MVQSAKKLRVPSLAAASTSSAVMAPWISVSQTTGNALVVQKRVRRAGHDAQLALEGVPALDGRRVAVVLLHQPLHGHREARDIRELFVGDLDVHVLAAVGDGLLHLVALRDGLFDLRRQLRQGDGRELDVVLFKQLAFVAHRAPEIEGPGAYLEDADAPEGLDHVADREEVAHAALEYGVGKAAVRQVCKGHAEAPEDLAGGEEAALRVAQARAVGLGALVQGAPEQYRDVQILCQPRAEVLGAEVAVRKQQPIHALGAEFFNYLQPVVLAVQQALLVYVVYVHKVNAQLSEPLRRQSAVLNRVRRAENAPPRRCKSQFDVSHALAPLFYSLDLVGFSMQISTKL